MRGTFTVFVAFSCLTAPAFAQLAGSQEAYRQSISGQLRADRAAIDREIADRKAQKEFLEAKQISRKQPIEKQSGPLPYGNRFDPQLIEANAIGRLDHVDTSIVEVIDESNCVLYAGKGFVWLQNFPTDELADGQKVRIIDYVKGMKSKQHKGHFMRTIEVISIQENDAQMQKDKSQYLIDSEKQKREAEDRLKHEQDIEKQRENLALRSIRKWNGKNGQEIKGKFVRLRSNTVEIELENGKKTTFRITALADQDAAIVRQLAEEDKQASKQP